MILNVTTAGITDCSSAVRMVNNAKENLSEIKNILVDAGYTVCNSNKLEQLLKRSELHSFAVLPKRLVVERSFTWLEKS